MIHSTSCPSFWGILFLASFFWACEKDNCPDSREINVVPESALILQGRSPASVNLRLEYPTNCSQEPYNGYFGLSIENPDVIPGALITFSDRGNPVEDWFNNGAAPSSGQENIQLYVFPNADGPAIPSVGSYQVVLRATFSDPDQQGTFILNVEVIDEGFRLLILEPNSDQIFFQGQDSVSLKAFASDQTNGIASLAYRLDSSGTWISQNFPDLPPQVNLETMVHVPRGGDHQLFVRALNGLQDSVLEVAEFRIPIDSFALNDYFWDGGGDNLNWGDPLNWAGDRLPGPLDHAIIDLPGTQRVLVSSDQSSPRVFETGGLRVNADLLIENSAVLQIEGGRKRSVIRGSVRFNRGRESNPPTLRFGANAESHTLEIRDTLYINGATLVSWSEATDNEILLNYTFAEQDFSGETQIDLYGPIYMHMQGLTNQLMHVRWNMYGTGLTEGAPLVRSVGIWRMINGSSFFADIQNGSTALVTNFSGMQIIRESPSARFSVGGEIEFDISKQWIDFPASSAANTDGGTIILEVTSPQRCNINRLQTKAKVIVKAGDWFFSQPLEATELSIEGNATLDLLQVNPGLRRVRMTSPDATLLLGEGSMPYLYSEGYVGMRKNIQIDSLLLKSGRFDIGSITDSITVSTTYLDWQGAQDISLLNQKGALVIGEHPDQVFSLLRPGPGASNPNQYWNTHIHLQENARLQWISGFMNSLSGRRYVNLDIGSQAIFEIPQGVDRFWGWSYNTGRIVTYLRITNAGAIIKRGDNRVGIAGCLSNVGDGYVRWDDPFEIVQHEAVCE